MCFFSKWLLAPPSCLACEAKSTLWLFKGCCTLTGHLAKAILFFSSNKYCFLFPFYTTPSFLFASFHVSFHVCSSPCSSDSLYFVRIHYLVHVFLPQLQLLFLLFFSISAVSLPWFCCFSTHMLSLSCIHWPPLTYYYQTLVPLHVC